jgi:hypothetical protein
MSNYIPNEDAHMYAQGRRIVTDRWAPSAAGSRPSSWTRVRSSVERTIGEHPGAVLVACLSVGLIAGWLIKRR